MAKRPDAKGISFRQRWDARLPGTLDLFVSKYRTILDYARTPEERLLFRDLFDQACHAGDDCAGEISVLAETLRLVLGPAAPQRLEETLTDIAAARNWSYSSSDAAVRRKYTSAFDMLAPDEPLAGKAVARKPPGVS